MGELPNCNPVKINAGFPLLFLPSPKMECPEPIVFDSPTRVPPFTTHHKSSILHSRGPASDSG